MHCCTKFSNQITIIIMLLLCYKCASIICTVVRQKGKKNLSAVQLHYNQLISISVQKGGIWGTLFLLHKRTRVVKHKLHPGKKNSCTNRNKTSTSISICTCFYSRISVKSVFAVFQFCFVLSSFYLNLNIKRKISYVSSLGLGFMSVSGKVV